MSKRHACTLTLPDQVFKAAVCREISLYSAVGRWPASRGKTPAPRPRLSTPWQRLLCGPTGRESPDAMQVGWGWREAGAWL